ncbi:Uu.00g046940.m01.CDS01 [Anthostomella pinea]|uniref:Uu.00g046940.m01.CDS01 n=1 Tax=Anthostomella pinea TaxID=933095 RepID=A0AAI8YEG4_9PEZI|nr:Uu.00g046940.m01.CDS01 [Anthostomella pinea]
MVFNKRETTGEGRPQADEDAPPAYDETTLLGTSSSRANDAEAPPPAPPAKRPGQTTKPTTGTTTGPTVEEPFNFPSVSDAALPPYSTPSGSNIASSSTSTPQQQQQQHHRPIAIPQTQPTPTAPFLPAYAPSLLRHGIPATSFRSFLSTLSAFLSSRVSERALQHTADMAQNLGAVPRTVGRETAAHARDVGRNIVTEARRGNLVGAGVSAIVQGGIALPLGFALRTVGAIFSLPGAVARRPLTPRERADVYVACANRDWFHPRGLHAALMDGRGLAQVVGGGVGAEELVGRAWVGGQGTGAGDQMAVLERYLAPLEIAMPATPMGLEVGTLWLVMLPKDVVQ